ncbi:MAG TPA: hypothetical protein VGS41_13110, partial [Chthonomonadales bacterium]|nr:hypothetical protein [Chthonomonadales bacterium]
DGAGTGGAGVTPQVVASKGIPPIRSVASLLDESLDLYKRHFILLALLVASVYLPVEIGLQALVTRELLPIAAKLEAGAGNVDPISLLCLSAGYTIAGNPLFAVPGLATLISLAIAASLVNVAISDSMLSGSVRFAACWRGARHAFAAVFVTITGALLATFAATTLSGLAIFFPLAIAAASLGNAAPQAARIVLTVLLIAIPYCAAAVVVASFFLFTIPALVLERRKVSELPTRNLHLTARRKARVISVCIVLPVLTLIGYGLVVGAAASVLDVLNLPSAWSDVANALVTACAAILVHAYWMVVVVVLYYDCRCKREGFDILLEHNALEAPREE